MKNLPCSAMKGKIKWTSNNGLQAASGILFTIPATSANSLASNSRPNLFPFISPILSKDCLVIPSLLSGSCVGSGRKLLLCGRSTCGPSKTWKDEHVWDTTGNLGSCEGRDLGKASKFGSYKSCVCISDNVDCSNLCLVIYQV